MKKVTALFALLLCVALLHAGYAAAGSKSKTDEARVISPEKINLNDLLVETQKTLDSADDLTIVRVDAR